MSVRQGRVHGRKVWQARVAYHGLRKNAVRDSKSAARDAEAELRRKLQGQHDRAEQGQQAPATLKALFEAYVADLAARGKDEETVARAAQTAPVVEAPIPELLNKPVTRITEADIFAFRRARLTQPCFTPRPKDPERAPAKPAEPAKPSTINRDLRTLRAMFKRVRPEFRFPADAFFPEYETRVRWLRPEEERLALESIASPFREMAKLASVTLMRLSEIRLL